MRKRRNRTAYFQRYWEENKEAIKVKNRAYYKAHREKIIKAVGKWKKLNRIKKAQEMVQKAHLAVFRFLQDRN